MKRRESTPLPGLGNRDFNLPLPRPMSEGMREEIRKKNTEYPKPSPIQPKTPKK